MYVISLCDYSGVWSQPYRDAGYDVLQIDLKLGSNALLFPSAPSEVGRFPREFADIKPYVGKTRAVLAAPVCTVFSGSGAKHTRTDEDIIKGLQLVDASYRIAYATKAEVFALENPVGKLIKWLGNPLLRFQPHHYAGWADDPGSEAYTKRTVLYGWFNNQLERKDVEPVDGSKLWRQYGGKSERTKEMRSITPQGFSRAFYHANQ